MAPISDRLMAATQKVMGAHDVLIVTAALVEAAIGENPRNSQRRDDPNAFFGMMWVAGELPLMAEYLDAQANLKKALAEWTAVLTTDKESGVT
jgi:hypothetical protein